MHNAAFRALGMSWTYELIDVAPGDLPAALSGLRHEDVAGGNVTIPHKQAVMQLSPCRLSASSSPGCGSVRTAPRFPRP